MAHIEQPLPVATDGPHIHDLVARDVQAARHHRWETVVADLDGRKAIGVARYGQPLQAHNGRDALRIACRLAALRQRRRQSLQEGDR